MNLVCRQGKIGIEKEVVAGGLFSYNPDEYNWTD